MLAKGLRLPSFDILTNEFLMLYLHIGTGKAGSSTIQSFLRNHRNDISHRQLEAFGIGNAWRISAASNISYSRSFWVDRGKRIPLEEYELINQNLWGSVKKEVEEAGSGDFIASSEYIYTLYMDDRDELEKLKVHLTEIFGQVKIIIYLRDQLEFLKSNYAQSVKGRRKSTVKFVDYMNNLNKQRTPYDYYSRIKIWIDIFGIENIEPVIFDRDNFLGNNLIDDLICRSNISMKNYEVKKVLESVNRSPCYSHINILRILNKLPWHGGVLRRPIYSLLRRIVPQKDFPDFFDDAIISEVSEGNAWLNERFFSNNSVKLPVLENGKAAF